MFYFSLAGERMGTIYVLEYVQYGDRARAVLTRKAARIS